MEFSFKNPSCFAEYTTKWKNGLQGRDRLSVDSNWGFWLHCAWLSKSERFELNLLIYRELKIMSVSRRHFLKYCAGSATVLGLEFSNLGTLEKVLAAAKRPRRPSYPISNVIYTTLDRTVVPTTPGSTILQPCQLSLYAPNGYGEW